MGIWVEEPNLRDNEVIHWKAGANRVLRSWMTSGGNLFVTNQRILYQPNRLDIVMGREPWECPLEAVVGINTVSRDRTFFAGGMRKRLGVRTSQGTEVFVVNRLGEKVEQLRNLLQVFSVQAKSHISP